MCKAFPSGNVLGTALKDYLVASVFLRVAATDNTGQSMNLLHSFWL